MRPEWQEEQLRRLGGVFRGVALAGGLDWDGQPLEGLLGKGDHNKAARGEGEGEREGPGARGEGMVKLTCQDQPRPTAAWKYRVPGCLRSSLRLGAPVPCN